MFAGDSYRIQPLQELQEQLDRAEKGKFKVGYFKYKKKVHQDDSIEITDIKFVEDTTGYESESNWFDKICNWLSNFFGG